jgi:hypothetical protein
MGVVKTYVIQLDTTDDVASVRDKLAWAKSARILLLYPRDGKVLARPLDLMLLQRHAAAQGAQLGLVSRSPEVLQSAVELGIPVFRHVIEAQKVLWPESSRHWKPSRRASRPELRAMRVKAEQKKVSWLEKPAVRIVVFSLGVAAMLAVLSIFIPSAEITLYHRVHQQSITIAARAGAEVRSVSVTGSLPAQTITVQVSGSKEMAVSGHIKVPGKSAKGTVVFSNLTDGIVGIPAGTVVRTNAPESIRYATTMDGVVEAGVDKSLEVPVQAVEGGTRWNVSAGQVAIIEGALGASLSVSNQKPITGGTDLNLRSASETDNVKVYAALMDEMKQIALQKAGEQLGQGDLLFEDTIVMAQIVSKDYYPAEGQPGEALVLELVAEFSAQYASAEDLSQLATAVLDASLPEGFSPLTDSLSIAASGIQEADVNAMTAFELRASRSLVQQSDAVQVSKLVQGRRKAAAAEILKRNLDLSSAPEISTDPSWWPWLPLITFRIAIIQK